MESAGRREDGEAERFVFVDEMGANIALSSVYAWLVAKGATSTLLSAVQLGAKHHAPCEHDP